MLLLAKVLVEKRKRGISTVGVVSNDTSPFILYNL
jgi:hypothetical protein